MGSKGLILYSIKALIEYSPVCLYIVYGEVYNFDVMVYIVRGLNFVFYNNSCTLHGVVVMRYNYVEKNYLIEMRIMKLFSVVRYLVGFMGWCNVYRVQK